MNTRTASQNRQLFALLKQNGFDDESRAELAWNATGGRTSRTSELTEDECARLIAHLRSRAQVHRKPDLAWEKANKMRRKILSMAHELWWRTPDGKADMQRINGWCVERGQFHKPLNDHSLAELPALVSQFEIMYKKALYAK